MSNEIAISNGNLPLTKDQVVAQTSLVRRVMEAVMKVDTHYGIIPGCKQPSLFKAGSEKILSTFRIAAIPKVEDLSTHDCFRYRVTCEGVLPSGEIVGAGIGEASTDEEKYKWRAAICLLEYEATPEDRRRFKYLKEPTTWNKEGLTRQVRTNPSDLANTVLKMAKKRAQIDLTLTCTACSDVFVQDLEDLSEELRDELVGNEDSNQRQGKPDVKPPQSKQQPPPAGGAGDKPITEAQGKMLYAKCKNKGVSVESLCAHFKIEKIENLPFSNMNPALKALDAGEIAEVVKTTKKEEELPVICSDCNQPYVDGACHNRTCPECRDED